ncbi:MAG: putative protease [Labilithrix sp.]|nr:putative protease [Labilithrix sp.]
MARPSASRSSSSITRGLAAALLAGGLATAGAAGAAPPPLPSPASAPAGDVSGFTADQVRRGIVQIEQNGRALGVGTVLLKDGRVLTALSVLGGGEQADIRYADGTVVKARVGHHDKAWDLALLVPQSGKWLDGLVPTDSDPLGADLRSFAPRAGKLAAAPIAVKGRLDARSKEGEALKSALELDAKGGPSAPGAPLLDANGRVVGIVVRACKEGGAPPAPNGAAPCTAISVGAPVYALRGFLVKTPATAVAPAPWLGMGGAPNVEGTTKGVKVMGVAPGSPAEKGGLKPNEDMIIAVDGQPVETPEQLAEVIAKRAIGQQVKLLVFSSGKFRDASVTLRAAP